LALGEAIAPITPPRSAPGLSDVPYKSLRVVWIHCPFAYTYCTQCTALAFACDGRTCAL